MKQWGNTKRIHRISSIFGDGETIVWGYNPKRDTLSRKTKEDLGIKTNYRFFDNEKKYKVLERITNIEYVRENKKYTFINKREIDELLQDSIWRQITH